MGEMFRLFHLPNDIREKICPGNDCFRGVLSLVLQKTSITLWGSLLL